MKAPKIIILLLIAIMIIPAFIFAENENEKEIQAKIIVKTDDGKEYVYEGEDALNFDIDVEMEGTDPVVIKKLKMLAPDGKELDLKDFDIDIEMLGDMPMMFMGGCPECMIPDLTDEQKKKIDQIKYDIDKKRIDVDAMIKKHELELQKFINDDAKLKDMLKKVEEIGKVRTEMEKLKIEEFAKIRDVLTKEQKEIYRMTGPLFFEKGPKMDKKVWIEKRIEDEETEKE